jgi:hypothetical protein
MAGSAGIIMGAMGAGRTEPDTCRDPKATSSLAALQSTSVCDLCHATAGFSPTSPPGPELRLVAVVTSRKAHKQTGVTVTQILLISDLWLFRASTLSTQVLAGGKLESRAPIASLGKGQVLSNTGTLPCPNLPATPR